MNVVSTIKGANAGIFIASSVFWARFELALFMPTFFIPSGGTERFYGPFLVVALAASLAVLLLASFSPTTMLRLLSERSGEMMSVLASLVGGACAVGGSYVDTMPVVLAGAVLCGVGSMYSMVSWAQLYAKNGTKEAAILLTGSMSVGTLIQALVLCLDPFAAALFTITMPVVVVAILSFIRALSSSEAAGEGEPGARSVAEVDDRADARGGIADPTESVFVGAFGAYHDAGDTGLGPSVAPDRAGAEGRRAACSQSPSPAGALAASAAASGEPRLMPRPFGIPIALFCSFFFFGISFGYLQVVTVGASPVLAAWSAQAMALVRGGVAVLAFLALCWSARAFYYLLLVGLLASIAGFSLVPVFEPMGAGGTIASCYLIAVGTACMRILLWLYLVELSKRQGRSAVSAFGPGLFSLHIGVVCGYLVVTATVLMGDRALHSALLIVIGYLLVIGVMLLFVSSTNLWALIRAALLARDGQAEAALDGRGGEPETQEQLAERLSAEFGLTPREREVFAYLLKGRSRSRIAEALTVSENTVNTHVNHIYQKMDVHNYQDFLDVILKDR